MDTTRLARLQSLIQQELSVVINREIKDPRVPTLTLTQVQLTPDAGQATVFFTILGATPETESDSYKKDIKDCLEGLNSASGFLRRHIGKILTIRHIPTLVFKEDRGLNNALRIHELLKEISNESIVKNGTEDPSK